MVISINTKDITTAINDTFRVEVAQVPKEVTDMLPEGLLNEAVLSRAIFASDAKVREQLRDYIRRDETVSEYNYLIDELPEFFEYEFTNSTRRIPTVASVASLILQAVVELSLSDIVYKFNAEIANFHTGQGAKSLATLYSMFVNKSKPIPNAHNK